MMKSCGFGEAPKNREDGSDSSNAKLGGGKAGLNSNVLVDSAESRCK